MKKLTELTTKLLANTCSELATMEALLASSSAVMSEGRNSLLRALE
jgi:hypothetical protein